MKTLYIDAGMGAAGDMLTAALLELVPDKEAMVEKLNSLGIPEVVFEAETSVKCGITGTHMSVRVHGVEESEEVLAAGHDHEHLEGHVHDDHEHDHDHNHEHHHHHDDHNHDHHHHDDHDHEHHHHDYDHDHEHDHHHDDHDHEHHHHDHDHDHEHHDHDHHHHHHHGHSHTSLADIEHIVMGHLDVDEKTKKDVLAVYKLIAEAESHAHGRPVEEIHFHEVGTMDAVADITAACLLMNTIAPEEVIVSPVHVGCGTVRCAHGILPVPAPATAHILRDVPIYGGRIEGELCTPTGAALLKHFATRFGDMPVMRVAAIGYGMGKKDFPRANCVRAMLGEKEGKKDYIIGLSCNVDDMTAEEVGFAMNRLFEVGAREVFTQAIGMKKNRPGTLLTVFCTEEQKEEMVRAIFRYTTTIGVRETEYNRYVLDRRIEKVETEVGEVRRKVSFGYGVERSKYEYDDLSEIAEKTGMTIAEVRKKLPSV